MKANFMVLVCMAAMMTSCGGNTQQSSSVCPHGHHPGEGKACSKEAVCPHGHPVCPVDKACCAKAADMKKVIGAQIFIKPEKVNDFLAASKSLIDLSRAEAGCISYTLYRDPQDETKFFFFEEWKNQAAVDFHFATEHFKKLGEILNECSSAPAVITVYDTVAEKKA